MRSSAHIVQGMGVESFIDHAMRKLMVYYSPGARMLHLTRSLQGNSIASLAEPMAHVYFTLGTAPGRLHDSGAQYNAS